MSELPAEALGTTSGSGRLTGRRILVVGAGTRPAREPDGPIGNGRAISVLCAREGSDVACLDIDAEAAVLTSEMVHSEGRRAVALVGDVADPQYVSSSVDEAAAALGGLDGLVLNVGIGKGTGLRQTSVQDWDAVFAVNVRAHFLMCQAAMPLLPAQSAIVFISSVAGIKPGSRIPAYDSSKSALAGLCRHVAAEGARRGVRANVVAPGLIDTPLGRWASAGRPSRDRAPVALGRQGTAWEVAQAAVWLLSNQASYVTGQVIAVDGGLSTL